MLALELPPQASTASSETVGNWPAHPARTNTLYGRTHTSHAVRVETLLHTHLSLAPPCEPLRAHVFSCWSQMPPAKRKPFSR